MRNGEEAHAPLLINSSKLLWPVDRAPKLYISESETRDTTSCASHAGGIQHSKSNLANWE